MIVKFRNYFFTGLAVTLPLLISVWFISWLFMTITNAMMHGLPLHYSAHPFWGIAVRVVILIAIIFLLVIVGAIARLVFVRQLFGWGEKLLVKIPLFNKVYTTIKQIMHAFVSGHKTVFKRVVLVEYPRKGLYAIGFVTSKAKGEVQNKTKEELVNIFVPTTPNPTSGVLVFTRQKDVIEMDMTVEEGIKLVISGGVVTPNNEKKRQL